MSFQRPDPISEAAGVIAGAARGDYDETVGRGVERVIDTASGTVRPRDSGMRGGRPAERPPERRAARESDLEQTTGISRTGGGRGSRPVMYWTLEECRGRGGTYTPYDPNTRAPRCDDIPVPVVEEEEEEGMAPLQPPVDDPATVAPGGGESGTTGEQAPGDRSDPDNPLHRDEHKHDRSENPYSGSGTRSGADGSQSMTGHEGVEHFTGGTTKTIIRGRDPIRETMNLIRSLRDPYGEIRNCKTSKKLVE